MSYEVIVRPEAEEDLVSAFKWYENRRKGLGYDFLLQVEAGINFIARFPEIHPIEYKGTRKHLISRFPYKLIYLVDTQIITILAILHERRHPELTKERIDESKD